MWQVAWDRRETHSNQAIIATRPTLLTYEPGIGPEHLGVPAGTERDLAGRRRVQADRPTPKRVWTHQTLPSDPVDGQFTHRGAPLAVAMIYGKLEISEVVKRQRGRRHAEAGLPGIFTNPLDDEVNVEHQIAAPILPFAIAKIKPYPVDEVVVPTPDEIVVVCATVLGISRQRGSRFLLLSSSSRHNWAPCNAQNTDLIRQQRVGSDDAGA